MRPGAPLAAADSLSVRARSALQGAAPPMRRAAAAAAMAITQRRAQEERAEEAHPAKCIGSCNSCIKLQFL